MPKGQNSNPNIESSLEYARALLREEARALEQVADLLGAEFENALSLILELAPQDRIILTGMGKAGIIAQKISATFASIGIPSFFLHPAEAVHGDLGRFHKKDIALILSNSGETPEIMKILPFIRRIGCTIVSMTARADSTLGTHSDVVLQLGELSEVGPLGLAPTTSTTAMLALGDALAMTVLKRQGLSREQYAALHPGGSLGRSLLKVSDLMRSGDEQCTVPETMGTKQVLHQISVTKGRPGAAAIVDKSGKLVGVFTDGNLRRCLEGGSEFLDRPISAVMTRNPKVITADKLATEALRLLSEWKIDQLIVVDGSSTPIGVIDIQDLV